jgi:hypothetical protein
MNRVELENTELSIPDLAELAKTGTVILTRHGKALAAVKTLPGADWESISLANNPQFRALIEESRRSYREQGGQSLDEIRTELGLAAKGRRAKAKRKVTAKRA